MEVEEQGRSTARRSLGGTSLLDILDVLGRYLLTRRVSSGFFSTCFTTCSALKRSVEGRVQKAMRGPLQIPDAPQSVQLQWTTTGTRFTAIELQFREVPPYDVVGPPLAKERLSSSLRCARSLVSGEALRGLQDELTRLPRDFKWGTKSYNWKSRRNYLFLKESVRDGIQRGEDGVGEDIWTDTMTSITEAEGRLQFCTPHLGEQLRDRMLIEADELLGAQGNYQHEDYSFHRDDPDGDGFGKHVLTVNVRGTGTVIIEDVHVPPGRRGSRRQAINHYVLYLNEGDVWAMPGNHPHGHTRCQCTHGLTHSTINTACKQGCTACRMSLNFRFGRVDDDLKCQMNVPTNEDGEHEDGEQAGSSP